MYLNKTLTEMTTTYTRLINQCKYNYHIIFTASFYKIIEEDQRSDEGEKFFNLNINQILTESDTNNFHVETQLEQQSF